MNRSAALLQPASLHTAKLLQQAEQAATTVNVLTAEQTAAELAQMAREVRQSKKAQASDLALSAIIHKLSTLKEGEGNLDTLVRVVTGLDPDQQTGSGSVVVQVQVSQEWRER